MKYVIQQLNVAECGDEVLGLGPYVMSPFGETTDDLNDASLRTKNGTERALMALHKLNDGRLKDENWPMTIRPVYNIIPVKVVRVY